MQYRAGLIFYAIHVALNINEVEINSRCNSTCISVTDRPMQLLVGSAHNITRLSLDGSSVQHYFLSTLGVTVHMHLLQNGPCSCWLAQPTI